ncbi:hypothetical protein JCM10207_007517 [Rhodosporidiobolus poonsookiae]
MATHRPSSFSDEKLAHEAELIDDAHEQHKSTGAQQLSKLNAPAGYVPTDAEKLVDKAINRKLDFILLPICAINFLLCTTFARDANLQPDDISDAVSLLSVTFVTLQPAGIILGRRIGVTYWIPLIMISHASFFPSTVYYLSTMYTRYSLGFRLGLFAGMYSIASAFSGLIAYGCFQYDSNPKFHGWQLFFVLLGAITILFALITFLVLPRDNHRVWFLTPAQQAHLDDRMERDVAAHTEEIETSGHRVSWRNIKDALVWHKIIIIIGNIMATLPVSAFGVFAPLVVQGMGYHGVKSNLMAVPPFFVGACILWCFLYSSDHFRERSGHTCAAMALAIVGLAVMYGSDNDKLRYGFLHVCLAGAFVGGPCILAWLAGNTPVTATRAFLIGLNGYSNVAGVIAGQLFKKKYAPSYAYPVKVTMILMAVGIVIFMSMRTYYVFLNKKRRAKVATMRPDEIEAERLNPDRRGDQKITFYYGL